MKFAWPVLFLLLCSFSLSKQPSDKYEPSRKYSSRELKEDLAFLRKKYEHQNPNLYLYTSKAELDRLFDSLDNAIVSAMTDIEFYRHIGLITSRIKDAHTSVFPQDDCEWWYGSQDYFFPLMITCNNNRIFTDLCASADRTIPDGSEILSINGRSSQEILARLNRYAARDGYNESRINWLMNNAFAHFYCYCIEFTANYEIEYKTPSGEIVKHRQPGLAVDSIYANAYRFYPKRYISGRKDSAITLRFQDDSAIAILRVRTFNKSGLKSMGVPSFKAEMKRCFDLINHCGVKNLVIDVRDNGGGNPEYARYLVSHLIDSSFIYIEQYKKVNRFHWNNCASRCCTRWYPYCGIGKFHPKKPVYSGKLYVLMDGGSTSTAGDFVACLDYYNRATFIGEESGSNRVVSGGNVFESTFALPHTKLKCRMSTIQGINKVNQQNDGHGVIPDYVVVPTPDDYMTFRNPMLVKALELIHSQEKIVGE